MGEWSDIDDSPEQLSAGRSGGRRRRRRGRQPGERAARLGLLLVLGFWWSILPGARPLTAAATERPSANSPRPVLWEGRGWRIAGSTIDRTTQTIVIDDPVAQTAIDGDWRWRADRMVGRVDRCGGANLVAIWLQGRVRIIGPDPLYVTGHRAVSFRPAASLTVDGATDVPSGIVGDGWQMTGPSVTVDLVAGRLTVDRPGRRWSDDGRVDRSRR